MYFGESERLVVSFGELLLSSVPIMRVDMSNDYAYLDIGDELIDVGTVEVEWDKVEYTFVGTSNEPFLPQYQSSLRG